MPFIPKRDREEIDGMDRDPATPGERCYCFYKDMVSKWRKNPRWTTADSIYQQVCAQEVLKVQQVAKELAWQVFFNIHVMPYELQKEREHGTI